jgi:HEAT repeat protein
VLLVAAALQSFASSERDLGAQDRGSVEDDQKDKIARYRKQLASKEPRERATAANQLGHLGATDAMAQLKELLRDDSPEVQYFAMGALVDLDAEGLAADARRFLESAQPNLRIVAAQALLASGDRDSIEAVLRLLDDSTPYIQHSVALLLGLFGVTEAVPSLEKLLATSSERTVRYWSLSALGMLGRKESGPAVARFLEDPDPDMQRAALPALAQIDPARYRKELLEALASDSRELKGAALQGLARIQDPEALKMAMEAGHHGLLNHYHAPATVSLLEEARIPRKLIRRETVPRILGVLSERTGIKMELSRRVDAKFHAARYGPNFQMLGNAPSALAVLGSFNEWFLDMRSSLSFVVERDLVRVVTPEEAREFWDTWARERTWIQLFNGKDLEGWTVKIKGHPLNDNHGDTFRVEDGVLKVLYDKYANFDGKFGHLFYKERFSHYRLRVEYRFLGEQIAGGPSWAVRNSGVMIHGQSPESMDRDQEFPVSIEVQFLGGDGRNPRPTGNLCTPGTNVVMRGELVTRHCTDSTSETFHGDQWVMVEVEVHGDGSIKHIVNGKTVLEYEKPQVDDRDPDGRKLIKDGVKLIREGYIALQSESHPIEFRKVELLPLAE